MRPLLVLLAAGALVTACARIQEISPLGPIPLVMADAPAQVSAIAYQLPAEPSAGTRPDITILRGAACALGSQRASRAGTFIITDAEYANVFQDELRRAGYQATDAVPAGAGSGRAGYLLTATMSDVRLNICLPDIDQSNPYDGKGEAGMAVRWQVRRANDGRIVYTATRRGYARTDTVIAAAGRELLKGAFARAVHGLLADEGFRAVLRQGQGI
jgi:hypothetical protein